ncbi:hypothetical protein SCLCIDRAFT_426586 [Scleroderma citrinum Foug A]|uniref:Uncharacterized protein n=1 Tax=Scleroderma citrinum Foug A TaxID=1036808 RepID=A0A0C2YVP6_9AGAM|nr:hypothetical protein SCLCIDRAFT_426586 [Scleroderma citrinum Foug A]
MTRRKCTPQRHPSELCHPSKMLTQQEARSTISYTVVTRRPDHIRYEIINCTYPPPCQMPRTPRWVDEDEDGESTQM